MSMPSKLSCSHGQEINCSRGSADGSEVVICYEVILLFPSQHYALGTQKRRVFHSFISGQNRDGSVSSCGNVMYDGVLLKYC